MLVTYEGKDAGLAGAPPAVCHTFVTDGRIQFLGDCTHVMAGQTVDLPVWRRSHDWETSSPSAGAAGQPRGQRCAGPTSASDRATSAQANTGHAIQERDGARGTAQACSDGVGAVAAAAVTQQAQLAPALAAAAAQAQTLNKRADSTLATAGPDACASMQAMGDEWLKGRAKQ